MPLDGTIWFTDDERQVLLSVREQISKSGAWCQKRLASADGSRCLLGWFIIESRHYGGVGGLIAKLGGWVGLIEVNDVLCRSQDEVVAFLDRITR